MKKWEYMVCEVEPDGSMSIEDKLNSWGNLGFELVAVMPRNFRAPLYYFKREKTG